MKNSADQGGCNPQRPKAEVDNTLRDLQNSSYPTKAEFNNCFILFIQNISPFLTPATSCPTLYDKRVGSFTSPANNNIEDAGEGAYGLKSFLRQHVLLCYFKTLSVGPVWARTLNLPHGSPALHQLS